MNAARIAESLAFPFSATFLRIAESLALPFSALSGSRETLSQRSVDRVIRVAGYVTFGHKCYIEHKSKKKATVVCHQKVTMSGRRSLKVDVESSSVRKS